jgi:YbgC/YbaW family acyl-CoA thioester hydrolase
MPTFKQEIVIRENYLDLFGHMNNATYLELFEETRWDFLVGAGFTTAEIQTTNTGPVILECTIKFMRELRARDKVTVTVESIEYKDRVGKLRQQMIKSDGTIACEAIFTYGLFDTKTRKLVLPTPAWKKALGLE